MHPRQRLNDAYAAIRADELARRAAEAGTPQAVPTWVIPHLPPKHPLAQRARWATINPGIPFPGDPPTGGSAA